MRVTLSSRLAVAFAGLLALTLAPACGSTAPYQIANCTPSNPNGWSIARIWDEQTLSLIRQVIPAPGVHARNLFHLSAAMWDAWAAYDPTADGYFVTEKHSTSDAQQAREVAMSYAAYRILSWRYTTVSDLTTAQPALDQTLAGRCLKTDYTAADGDTPADLGNRIAAAAIRYGETDGAIENERYVDSSYKLVNPPLVVSEPGTTMADPNRWQPLSLGVQLSQNGIPIPGKEQTYIGAQWGHVTPFALPASADGLPIDPGPPPRLGSTTDAGFKQEAIDVLSASAMLDVGDGVELDISPASIGNNSLGANDGSGRPVNPITSQPYAPEIVARADYYRVLAEWWADGPTSETPPGHWNVIANVVADTPGFEHRFGGQGPELDRLEWDVKMYLAVNGAVHDAAIAAWGAKRYYETARPISMIRYMGGLGQSSDSSLPSFDPEGLPLVPGLVELITPESSVPGQRHADLREHVDEVAVRTWRGNPADPKSQDSGVGWILAVNWVPYQRPTFVTPAFPGYVSGHSSFSRAAAEVLTQLTGSEYFPGGLGVWEIKADSLIHELGPSRPLELQWATYYDAADQAGISRTYGGIHPPVDDFAGRRIGSACGKDAWALASSYFDGTARD